MATPRFPRFGCSSMKLMPLTAGTSPDVTSPRTGSPLTGRSTLMTSAPQSASTAPAAGTNHHSATSITRTPSRTPPTTGWGSTPRDLRPAGLLGAASGGAVRGLGDVEPGLRRAQPQVAQALDRLADRHGAEPARERNLDTVGTPLRFGGALVLGGEARCRGERQRERRKRGGPTQHVERKMQNQRQHLAAAIGGRYLAPPPRPATARHPPVVRFHDGGRPV